METLLAIVSERFGILEIDQDLALPRYNIAPTQMVPAIVADGDKYRLGTLKWGFIPFFAKDEISGSRFINAKAETIMEKPAFRQSFEKRRCLILADGFYEWDKFGDAKTPYRFILKDEPLMCFAGIWSKYVKPDGQKIFTCAILTTGANETMKSIHDRMPIILNEKAQQIWLQNKTAALDEMAELLKPYPYGGLEAYPVSAIVNNPRNDNAECIKRL